MCSVFVDAPVFPLQVELHKKKFIGCNKLDASINSREDSSGTFMQETNIDKKIF